METLIALIVTLIVVLLLLWCVQRLLAAFGAPEPVATVLWIVRRFGVLL